MPPQRSAVFHSRVSCSAAASGRPFGAKLIEPSSLVAVVVPLAEVRARAFGELRGGKRAACPPGLVGVGLGPRCIEHYFGSKLEHSGILDVRYRQLQTRLTSERDPIMEIADPLG